MRIIALYKEYNMVIKPLIAELEARTEQFPLPLFNEIRALHDHIARCYSERISSNQVDSEIHKAERQTKNVDLTVLQNGTFYPKYKTLRTKATKMVRKAKSLESLDTQSALDTYQNSYNLYCDLENVIEEVVPDLHWARIRFSVRKSMQVLLWILSAIASGVISIILAKYL